MKTIINVRWVFFTLIFASLTVFGIHTLDEDFGISLAIIILGAVFIIGYAFIVPNCITFSEEGITVRYCFGIKTFSSWNDLKHIEARSSRYSILPWLQEYHVGYFKSKNPFIQEACIPKNRKTMEQIDKYYKKSIKNC